MKVFNLKCEHGHAFEGWFRSHLAFEDQRSRGLLSCPFCESRAVEKTLSAPRLNLSGAGSAADGSPQIAADAGAASNPMAAPSVPEGQAQALAAALSVVREILSQSEDVGDRFADEVRAMQANEIPVRSIHGQTSVQTARELLDEGIPVVALPFSGLLKTPLQ